MTAAQIVRAAAALHRMAMALPAPALQVETRRLLRRVQAQARRETRALYPSRTV